MNLVLDELTAASPEAGSSCSLENYLALPDHSMDARIAEARAKLGATTLLLGHHYQRDEVIRFADFTGDSYKLSRIAAETDAKYIVFCGVHFMAESADVLGRARQQVILPDLNAGCSMADMAEISQVEACWEALERLGLADDTDSADLHELHRRHQSLLRGARRPGLHLFQRPRRLRVGLRARQTDSLSPRPAPRPQYRLRDGDSAGRDDRLGSLGRLQGGQTKEKLAASRILLWKGHCAVHQRFLPSHVDQVRAKYLGIQVIVHPECRFEVCQKADALGSTERLIALVEQAPTGSIFAVGTEIHLVNRMARRFAAEGKKVITLDDTGCLCTTMYRITPQHLAWALENLVEGRVVNRIQVRTNVKRWASVALDRMLEVG